MIISKVTGSVSRLLNGELKTGDITVDFLHYFPRTAIHFHDVSFRDSLFHEHGMEFLRARDVFLKVNFRDLFSDGLKIENLSFHNGSVYIFKDTAGYSNDYLLHARKQDGGLGIKAFLQEVDLKNFRFINSDRSRDRYVNIYFNHFRCAIHARENLVSLAVKSDGKIKMLGLNLRKGSYARDAFFSNDFIATWDADQRVLDVPTHSFYVNDRLLTVSAAFDFSARRRFRADFTAPRIGFDEALKLATARISRALGPYRFKSPLRLSVSVAGSMEKGVIPLVNAELVTAANELTFNEYTFYNSGLRAFYTNRTDTSSACSPANTSVVVTGFSGHWESLPVRCDSLIVKGFPRPVVTTRIYGKFPLKILNDISGGLYTFTNGSGIYEVFVNAKNDSLSWMTSYEARLGITNGSFVYEPRSLPFTRVTADIRITPTDVHIDKLDCRVGQSNLSLKGRADGIFLKQPAASDKLELSWELRSESINLDNFMPFMGKRYAKSGNRAVHEAPKSKLGRQIDQYLNACRLRFALDVASVSFENFRAGSLSGKVQSDNLTWNFEDIRFRHAGGHVRLSGTMTPLGDAMQRVSIRSDLQHVDIAKVFEAFNNFSQSTIGSQHIEGKLDARADLRFDMNHQAVISQNSMHGEVQLSVKDGELKGFQPLGKLSKFVFRKRDFSNIRFSELTNSFKARGSEIYFDRMKINSSVMELYVEGSYFLDGKTDMRIQVPLSNLKKRDWSELSDNITDKGSKGVNVFIHAQTDNAGELRFRYDPLHKIKEKRPAK